MSNFRPRDSPKVSNSLPKEKQAEWNSVGSPQIVPQNQYTLTLAEKQVKISLDKAILRNAPTTAPKFFRLHDIKWLIDCQEIIYLQTIRISLTK